MHIIDHEASVVSRRTPNIRQTADLRASGASDTDGARRSNAPLVER